VEVIESMEDMSICGLSKAGDLEVGGAAAEDALPQHALDVPEPDQEMDGSQAGAEADLRANYQRHIQRALRRIQSAEAGFVNADVVSLEGLTSLPGVSLKGVGRVALPLGVETAGTNRDKFLLHVCMHFHPRWLAGCMMRAAGMLTAAATRFSLFASLPPAAPLPFLLPSLFLLFFETHRSVELVHG
jgi:hypothetical protein